MPMSLGMAGGVQLPQPIPRRTIREEGARRQIEGTELEDFVEIITVLDDEFILIETEKQVAAAKAATSNLKRPTR